MFKTVKTEIKQLPSGYWSVWVNGNWIEASLQTELDAKRFLYEYLKKLADNIREQRVRRMENE